MFNGMLIGTKSGRKRSLLALAKFMTEMLRCKIEGPYYFTVDTSGVSSSARLKKL